MVKQSVPVHHARRVRWWMVVLAVFVGIAASFFFPWKLNFLRGAIGSKVEQATGRGFVIDGDLVLYWLQGPRITMDKVRFGNPAWTAKPDMLVADRVDATVLLTDLVRRRIVLPRVVVDAPDVHLEESADGRRNWYLDKKQSDSNTSVRLGAVTLNKGHLAYVVKHRDTDVEIDASTLDAKTLDTAGGGTTSRLALKASGTWNGLKLAGTASGGDVLRLADSSDPYAFDLKAVIGQTHVTADGSVTGVSAPTAADLKLDLAGASLAEWHRIAGIGLPETPPYRTSGRVRLADRIWNYDDFTGRFGSSDIAGSVAFESRKNGTESGGRTRSFISGKLVSKQLDLADLAPMVGKTAAPKRADGANVASARPAKLLPQQTFNTEKWNTLDADLRFTGKSIKNTGSIPFDDLDMHVVMQDRVLSLTPLSFGFADGRMGGNFRFDGSNTPMQAKVDARFADLRLSRLTPTLADSSKASLGRLNGTVKLEGHGNSIATMLGTSNGAAQIAMGRGELSSLLLELAGLQGPQIVRYLLGDRNAKVRCALGDFAIKNGDMTTRTALIDTDLNVIKIDGSANFATEQLDVKVTPLPKQKSIVVLRTPFYVTGTFVSPNVKPDYGTLAARGGGAIALGLINPLAALLPLIETAPGKDSDCAQLLSSIKNAPVKNTDDASQMRKQPAKKTAARRPQKATAK